VRDFIDVLAWGAFVTFGTVMGLLVILEVVGRWL
jgi:hypothetical protein